MSQAIDIVIPWINHGTPDKRGFTPANRELTYVLRSIEKHIVGTYRVTVVGDCPPNLGGIQYIPHMRRAQAELPPMPNGSRLYPKAVDAVDKMRLVLACPHIGEQFVYWYDDQVLHERTTAAELAQVYSIGELRGELLEYRGDGSHAHLRHKQATLQALKQAGYPAPIWDFETHVPRMFTKRHMARVLDRFKPEQDRLLLPTLYYNTSPDRIGTTPHVLTKLDQVAALFRAHDTERTHGQPPPGTDPIEHTARLCAGKRFINWNERGMHAGLQGYLRRTFPHRSTHEDRTDAYVWDANPLHV